MYRYEELSSQSLLLSTKIEDGGASYHMKTKFSNYFIIYLKQ